MVYRSGSGLDVVSEALGFSSNWYALVTSVTKFGRKEHFEVQTRNIPRVGQRQVGVPNNSSGQLPNVVLVLLESFSYSVTSLGNPYIETTPNLLRLSSEGVKFQLTRCPVSHTTKAFWAVLTSSTPVINSDYVEAIPNEDRYEGLPSILKRVGYRSAFFEVSKGTFECAPGFFYNLDFDWAWFRENLEDPSAYLGYVGGDDCRMLEPAFDWVSENSQPFLLMMASSVSHDPYDVPQWFEKAKSEPYEKYLQSIRYTDYFLGQLCKILKERNLEENTIVCVLGDHGTSFKTKKAYGRWIPNEEVIRIPWVIKWPKHVRAGQIIDWPCSQLDVTPTILNLIGFDTTKAGFEGQDAFVPSKPNRRFYFSSWFENSPLGYLEGNRKVIYWPYTDKVFEYNLDTDPEEQNPQTLSFEDMKQVKHDILQWEKKSQIFLDAKRHTTDFLFSHWQTFSAGRFARAYYVH